MDIVLSDRQQTTPMGARDTSSMTPCERGARGRNSEPSGGIPTGWMNMSAPSATSSTRRVKPRRSNSEPTGAMDCQQGQHHHNLLCTLPGSCSNICTRRHGSDACCRPSLPCCEVLRAYQDAVSFQERLRENYQTCKRVFILFRYRRLQTLVREATMDHRLRQLRQGIRCQCSCQRPEASAHGGQTLDGLLEDLAHTICPVLTKVKAYLQSAFIAVAPSLLMSSEPSLTTAPTPCCATRRLSEHEWQRSRIVLLERHLDRLRRECLAGHWSRLPLGRYRAMKTSLKHVLDARLV